MEYRGNLNKATGTVEILHIPTGFKFNSWADAIKHEVLCKQLNGILLNSL